MKSKSLLPGFLVACLRMQDTVLVYIYQKYCMPFYDAGLELVSLSLSLSPSLSLSLYSTTLRRSRRGGRQTIGRH